METKELIEQLRSCGEKNCPMCEDVESCVGPSWLLLKAAERLEGSVSREDLIKKIFPYGMPDDGNYPINAKAVMEAILKTK
jgi:hypothetical protein